MRKELLLKLLFMLRPLLLPLFMLLPLLLKLPLCVLVTLTFMSNIRTPVHHLREN